MTPSFNGPIQLLLQLINGHDMDVLDIPLAPVIEGFVAVLRDDSRSIDVDELSEFLLIAAILLEIKSTALLPTAKNTEEDEEFIGWEERDVFLARLLELRTYAGAADAFINLLDRAARSYPRLAGLDRDFVVTPPDLLAGVTPEMLGKAFIKGIEEKPVPRVTLNHVTVDAVTVAETVVVLAQRLPMMGRISFRKLVEGISERIEVIVHFLALLELCKLGRVDLGQGVTFGDLDVEWIGDDSVLEIGRVDVYEG
jgi:segregation and condensation protein A